jgi:hypothetical protein
MSTTLNTKISLRYDSYDNWNSSSGKAVILNKGEVGICAVLKEDSAEQSYVMFKVGNGLSKFEELPWTSGLAADVFDWAKQSGVYIATEGDGNIITNVVWDATLNNGLGGVLVKTKTLTSIQDEFAAEGMVASYSNGHLIFTNASKKNAVVSVNLS